MTRLSVCTLTADPGPRVAALLELLRPVADEIVVAADARADEDRLAHYAAVADRLERVEVDHSERHFAWLHAQCTGDWIFRIDGDEVPGAELIEQLPELIADRHVSQYVVPRRWLHTNTAHWLDGLPWWPDYQVRLVRNDGLLRFPGAQHTSAVPIRPARYLELPIYHLDLLVNREEARRAKAKAYEERSPGLEAPGGGPINERFYLPEDSDRTRLVLVPEADRAAIDRVLESVPRDVKPPDPLPPVTTTSETDRFHPRREVPASAQRAEIAFIESEARMQPGERRALHMRITNTGTDTWPWDADLGPPIRASYCLHNERGTIVVGDGPRTAFSCDVGPGESTVVPLDVIAPVIPGAYELAADVVHEGVRWFGCDARFDLEVESLPGSQAPAHAPSAGRLNRLASRLRRRGEPSVAKIVHRVWLGGSRLPEAAERYGESWRAHHPDWEHKLWREEEVEAEQLVSAALLARCRSASEQSNLVRYGLMARFGGVYVDTDMECLHPLDGLLAGVEAFAGWETTHRVGTAILGGRAGHPLFETAYAASLSSVGLSLNSLEANGPGLFTLLAVDRQDVKLFPPELFYPYRWDEKDRRDESFEGSFGVHHWDLSWKDG